MTNLKAESWPAQNALREAVLRPWRDAESHQRAVSLFASRVSAETLRANQVRLYFSALAYVLVHGLRRLGLQGTGLARAQVQTIRLPLLKIGTQIRVTVRKVWIWLASSFPRQNNFAHAWKALCC